MFKNTLHRGEVTQTSEVGGIEHTLRKSHSVLNKPTLRLCQRVSDGRDKTRKDTQTHLPSHTHTGDKHFTQPHTITHPACFVSTESRGRISVASSSAAPATGPRKRERGLTAGPRHSLGCFCVDGAEGGGIIPFHVSEQRHDATYLSGEALGAGERMSTIKPIPQSFSRCIILVSN